MLSNPPYVAERDRTLLPRDVVEHEPGEALFAGEDGLDTIRRLVPAAAATDATLLAVELGEGQAGAVAALVGGCGFEVEVLRDLAGIERVVVGRR